MRAAVYARKSTDQEGATEEQKSVSRQVEHATAYAARKGWTVAEDQVYVDDNVSGAEFIKRPGFVRMMNALKPRPPFDVLVVSEESRLGREQIETSFAVKQITDAGVQLWCYLADKQRTLDTAMDKVMLALVNFGSELEREKASQRTYDAMIRKAKALHVTGGKVFGYDNVEVLNAAGVRESVRRLVNPKQANVVRRIFEQYARGTGMLTIAHQLNAEGVKPPRGRGWAPSGIREMLHRPLYRGEIVWNKSQKVVRGGTKKQRRRDESEWITLPAPDVEIVSPELAARVNARLATQAALYPRGASGATRGKLIGRPRHQDESAYLLVGFAECGVCGGPVGTDLRAHGSAGSRRHVPHYACLDHKRRGDAICINTVGLRQDVLDMAILDAIRDILSPDVLSSAVDKALARLTATKTHQAGRRSDMERELKQVQAKVDRLVDALADGALPADEIRPRLAAEKSRKATLQAELAKLDGLSKVAGLDTEQLRDRLQARVNDTTALLGKQTPQARQMLRRLLVGKIALQPFGSGRGRGYRFTGALALDRLITGQTDVLGNNTSVYGGPKGEAPLSNSRSPSAASSGWPRNDRAQRRGEGTERGGRAGRGRCRIPRRARYVLTAASPARRV